MAIILSIQVRIIGDLSGAVLNIFYVPLTQPYELGLIVYLQVTKEEMVAQRSHRSGGDESET